MGDTREDRRHISSWLTATRFPSRGAACEPGGWWGPPGTVGDGRTTPCPGRGVAAPNCHPPLFTRPTALSLSDGCQGIQPLRAAGRAKSWTPRTHPQSRPGWILDALETLALRLQAPESHPCPHHLTFRRRMKRGRSRGMEGTAHLRLGRVRTFLCINHRQLPPPLECTLRRPASRNEISCILSKYAMDVGMNSTPPSC